VLAPLAAAVPAGESPRSITLNSAGRFAYVVNARSNDVSVYAIDALTGLPVAAGPRVATGASPAFMAIVNP
jgi:6-phosphogluconolactonase